MRDLNIHEQSHSNLGGAGKKLGKAGKKALSKIKKEHNGPDGHRIPKKFGTIAKYLEDPKDYHTAGSPPTMTSEESGMTIPTESVDEGQFSEIKYNIPEKPFVIAQSDSDKYQRGEKFWLND